MSAFLERVCRQKRAELARKRASRPLRELERAAAGEPVRPFLQAISGTERIIAEIKQKSPSVPSFHQGKKPDRLAEIYAANGAAAISIVTDELNFGTSLADVEPVRQSTSLPVLVKDFVIDPYQVIEARASGADAVLLIARILERRMLSRLIDFTRQLGISALVECHDAKDVEDAVACGAKIVGINNRDLSTLEVSLENSRRLADLVPATALRVAESGLRTRADIAALLPVGFNGFLVGGALLSSADPGRKLRELLGRDARVPKIKICGITRPEDAASCQALGADYLGVIFADSPRRVTPRRAREIREAVPGANLVGVFRDDDLGSVLRTAEHARLNLIQLHGSESPGYCDTIRERVSLPIVKTFHHEEATDDRTLEAYGAASYFLFDLPKSGAARDAGRQRLWKKAAQAGEKGHRVFLAGALGPETVREAVARTTPFGVDVCRGVEEAPGVKNHDAVRRFLTEARR